MDSGNVIHKDDVIFPNFSQNAANFPKSMGLSPIPKKGCESPAGRVSNGKCLNPQPQANIKAIPI